MPQLVILHIPKGPSCPGGPSMVTIPLGVLTTVVVVYENRGL
jgi:hypothetical protein